MSDHRAWWKDCEDQASKEREAIAAQGLNISGYAGKWKAAKEYESNNKRVDDTRLLPYWERVRLTFLELGGCYIDQNQRDRNGLIIAD